MRKWNGWELDPVSDRSGAITITLSCHATVLMSKWLELSEINVRLSQQNRQTVPDSWARD